VDDDTLCMQGWFSRRLPEEMCCDVVVAASHSIGAVVVDIEENARTRLD
jgi:hypothetical protein